MRILGRFDDLRVSSNILSLARHIKNVIKMTINTNRLLAIYLGTNTIQNETDPNPNQVNIYYYFVPAGFAVLAAGVVVVGLPSVLPAGFLPAPFFPVFIFP